MGHLCNFAPFLLNPMFKKIFTYGLAFGSLSAAFLFIHFNNYGPDQSTFQKGMYTLFQMLLLPATCVFLLVKNMRKEYTLSSDMTTPPKPGNLIMAALFASMVMAGVVSLMYFFIHTQYPHIIEFAKAYDATQLEAQKEKIMEGIKAKNDSRTYEEVLQAYFAQYTVSYQLRTNLFQSASISLFVAGIMSLVYMRRDKKESLS